MTGHLKTGSLFRQGNEEVKSLGNVLRLVEVTSQGDALHPFLQFYYCLAIKIQYFHNTRYNGFQLLPIKSHSIFADWVDKFYQVLSLYTPLPFTCKQLQGYPKHRALRAEKYLVPASHHRLHFQV